MKKTLHPNRPCRRVMPVTLTEVKVQVTQNRMILLLLVADAEQYELMQRAYAAVGEDFTGKDDLIGAK